MWVAWPDFQPVATTPPGQDPPGWTGASPAILTTELDAQIAAANQDGVNVILTIWRYPVWSNPITRTNAASLSAGKPPEMALPDDQSPTGPWAGFISFLMDRYSVQSNVPHVFGLEVLNEPNLMNWPVFGMGVPSGPATSPLGSAACACGIMMDSAATVNLWHGRQLAIMGPAAYDISGNTVAHYDWQDFQVAIAQALDSSTTPEPRLLWTHHPYRDVTQDVGTNPHTAIVVDLIAPYWNGMTGTGSTPSVWITECGVRREQLPAGTPQDKNTYHSARLFSAWNKVDNDHPDRGAHIQLFMNYLFHTDPTFDTGLREDVTTGGAPRSPVYNIWAAIPGRS